MTSHDSARQSEHRAAQQDVALHRDRPFGRWRTRDILIPATVGVVFGGIFIAWSALYAATGPIFTAFPPAQAILAGMWLVPGVLAAFLTRKAGAGLLAGLLAAAIELIFLPSLGPMILLYGLAQGLMADVGYAIFGYRMWTKINPFIAGAVAAISTAVLDLTLYYPTWAGQWKLAYGVLVVVSAAVLGGLITLGLHATLRASGALPARRS
jgi:energy-coupling factor transport system substrate-specific component